jgi:hypothetical protein
MEATLDNVLRSHVLMVGHDEMREQHPGLRRRGRTGDTRLPDDLANARPRARASIADDAAAWMAVP